MSRVEKTAGRASTALLPDLRRMHPKHTFERISRASGLPRFWPAPCWPAGSHPAMRAVGGVSRWTAEASFSGSDRAYHETAQ